MMGNLKGHPRHGYSYGPESMPYLVAICTNIMRWFASAHRRLQAISNISVSRVNRHISLLLCFPCFHASHYFFKLACLLNQRRALLVRREQAAVGFENSTLQIDNLGLDKRPRSTGRST